ncbi:MAG: Na/Pi cotransporter family protein, partial [bacterium]
MGDGLQRAAGDKVRTILKALTTNPLMGTLVGAIITAIIQSSSATSVLAIGFVNAGLMSFTQALGVIFGANIGTTVTAQVIAFKLTDYALIILAIGFGLNFFSKRRFWKHFGSFFLGLGILFLGLSIMTNVIKPYAASPALREAFIRFSNNPLKGGLAGLTATAIFQSSSATTGIVLTLASVSLIDLKGAIPIIIGCNIGTCITALLASIGTSIHARRTAMAHLMFNISSSLIFFPVLKPFQYVVSLTSSDLVRQCAHAHTFFNAAGALLFLPFINTYAKFIIRITPEGQEVKEEYDEPRYLESHLLNTPPVAIEAATREIIQTLRISRKMINLAMEAFFHNNQKLLEKIEKREDVVDSRRYAITNYLVELMEKTLSHEESRKIPALIHVVNDVERIGDHAMNLRAMARQKIEDKLPFSHKAIQEIEHVHQEVLHMIESTINALSSNDMKEAQVVLMNEIRINKLRDNLKNNHINRLNKGVCNVLSGIVFLDTIS